MKQSLKILFVSSGNSKYFAVSPFVKSQADSISKLGHNIDFYTIKGKGLLAYLKNIIRLKKYIHSHQYDLVHAHYSLCGIVAALASDLPVVTSLLGSDIICSKFWRFVSRIFASRLWSATIVKSAEMQRILKFTPAYIIPNGVELDKFYEMDKAKCRVILSLETDQKYTLFAADPNRRVKNFALAQAAVDICSIKSTIISLKGIPHSQVPIYLNAADVVVLASFSEGSPNTIKEAMACNCPIVSTDVGDVKSLLEGLQGCYIAKLEPDDFAAKIDLALQFPGKTAGSDRLKNLGLDSVMVAQRIIEIYQKAVDTA